MAHAETGDAPEQQEKKACCFPMEPFAICGGACFCLPATWKKIQDSTHLVMVIGVISCIVLVVLSAVQVYNGLTTGQCTASTWFCADSVVALFFAGLLATYVSSIISQWDDQLMAKEAAVKEQKAKLLNSYNELLSDMDGLLTNATESASGLAERSFESKRRDFQRFLERAKSRFSSNDIKADMEMLRQFRRFCVNWLNVFKECSIDPVGRPTDVVTEEELERQVSIQEVADLCLERLRVTEVRFISAQRDKDRTQLNDQQRKFRRQEPAPRILAIEAGGNDGKADIKQGLEDLNKGTKKSRTSWLKFGGGGRCKCDNYPLECTYICGSVQCLSKQHSTLLMVFGLGVALLVVMVLEMASGRGMDDQLNAITLALVVLGELCAVVVLINFEDIDVVQKLEREVSELQEQNTQVTQQREKMKEFWSSAQNLTELWLYRTVPRLDLYKELHSQLEDVNEEDLLSDIAGANDALESLEGKLGALEYWRNDGALKTEDKKLFGKTVNEVCQIGQFSEMLTQLEDDVIRGPVMQKLKALPQSHPHDGARRLA